MSDNSLFDDNPFNDVGIGGGSFTASVRHDAKRGALYCVDPSGPGENRTMKEIQIGTTIVIDIGATIVGGVQFKPRFVRVMVPLGAPEPAWPKDLDLQTATQLSVLVAGHGGLRSWLITGKILLNALSQATRLASYKREVSEGKIPAFVLRGFTSVPTNYGTFYAPILELDGFIDRDTDVFGPRIVPPPPPILPSRSPAPQLPSSDAAETPETSDQESAPRSSAKPPNAVPANEAPASKDPFETYKPISGRKPY